MIAAILYGIKPTVVTIVLAAAWRIGSRTLKNPWLVAIAVAAFVAIAVIELPFPLIVAAAALTGFVGGRVAPFGRTTLMHRPARRRTARP